MSFLSSKNTLAVLSVICLSGCQTLQDNQDLIGGALGSGLGAYAGSQFGKGSGKQIATVAGGLIGAYAGYELTRYLTKEDQESLSDTTQKTLETDKPNSFIGKSGVMGETQVIDTSTQNSKQCKTVQQTISLQDGSTKTENIKACKGANGWEQMPA